MKPTTTKRSRRSLTAADAPPVSATPDPVPETSPVTPDASDGVPNAPPPVASSNAMICLIPPPELAAKLAIVGGEDPGKLHVTLMYLGATDGLVREDIEDAIASTLEALADLGDDDGDDDGDGGAVDPDEDGDSGFPTLTGTFNGTGRFTADPDKGTPIVTTLDAPGLMPLVDNIAASLREQFDSLPAPTHGLVPHMTLQYRPDITDSDPVQLPPPSDASVTFDHLVLAWGDSSVPENLTFFPLSGEEPQVPEDKPGSNTDGNDADASTPDTTASSFPAPASGNGTAPSAADGAPVTAAGPAPVPAAVPAPAAPVPPAPAPDATATVICPTCGTANAATATTCTNCGATLPAQDPDTATNADGAPAGQQAIASRFRGVRGYPAAWAAGDDPPPDAPAPDAPAPDAPADPSAPADGGGRVQPVVGQLGMWEACIVTAGQPTDADDVTRLIPTPDTLSFREPPLPVTFTLADTGHADAPIGGAATKVWWDGNNLMAQGPYLSNPDGSPTPQGQAFKDAVDGGAPIGPSIDMGGSATWNDPEGLPDMLLPLAAGREPTAVMEETVDESGKAMITLVQGIVCGFAVLPFPAQDTTWIRSMPGSGVQGAQVLPTSAPATIPGEPAPPPVMASGMVASGADLYPPAEWFRNPGFTEPTPLTVTADGRVYGHIATWGACHRSYTGKCLSPPTSKTGYREFLVGSRITADGSRIPTGKITVGIGHFASHADNVRFGAADVNCGEDKVGIWVAGAKTPDATVDQLTSLQASAPSGDWREVCVTCNPGRTRGQHVGVGHAFKGNLELHALINVNTPGFAVPRVRALVASGEVTQLVASGAWLMEMDGASWAVTGAAGLPLADRDASWDGDGAAHRVAKLYSSDGSGDPATIDWSKYSDAFFYRDDSGTGDPTLGDFSLGFADVVNGRLEAVPNGIIAVAGVLSGGRGGASTIPQAAQDQIKGRVAAYYEAIAQANPDFDPTPPWEDSQESLVAAGYRRAAKGLLTTLDREVFGRPTLADRAVFDVERMDREVLGSR